MTKNLAEWTEEDLSALIRDGVQESLNLDYKESRALDKSDQKKMNEMSKDVSAFANSDGGRIVYGIVEIGHIPSSIDAGVTDAAITREWIEQKLQSTIRPRVQGLMIRQIDLSSGGRAFVIDIPAATTFAPHMASDHKYYRRFNFNSVPMEDYEVKEAMNRAATPDLFAKFTFGSEEIDVHTYNVVANVYVSNRAATPSLYNSINVIVSDGLMPSASGEWTSGPAILALNGNRRVTVFSRNLIVPHHQPLWRGKSWGVGEIRLNMIEGQSEIIGWQMEWPSGWSQQWTEISMIRGTVQTKEVMPPQSGPAEHKD